MIITAVSRTEFFGKILIDKKGANFIFEGHYSSATELIHALVLKKGYRVDNHLCLGYYLRDCLEMPDLFNKFNACRAKRNKLMYEGKRMEFETAKEAIMQITTLIKNLKIIHDL